MRIIVTGAAGLIGSAVATRLGREHEVIGVDLRTAPTVIVQADCGGVSQWGPSVGSVDAIVHVAALHAPHVGLHSTAEFRRNNVDATARLLDFARRSGARHFVYASTTSLYGHALDPIDGAVWVDEHLTPQPRDIYDETKLDAENLVAAAADAALTTTILRMSRCFPEPAADMAAYRLHRGIDRRDVARAHSLALNQPTGRSRTYVISAATPFLRDDCPALLMDAPSVIEQRCPGLIDHMERRGWAPPSSIDRVYDSSAAGIDLEFRARYGIDSCIDGDWDPEPSQG